jgi:hypothetical protein
MFEKEIGKDVNGAIAALALTGKALILLTPLINDLFEMPTQLPTVIPV